MTALTVRDLSEETVKTYKVRAAAAGQSLQGYMRSLLETEASAPTNDELLDRLEREASAAYSNDDLLFMIDEGRAER